MPRAKATDPDAKRFGEIMLRMRWQRDWTLDQLGKVSGMHPDYLGLLERGLNVPSLSTILRIAEVFDVPAGKLLDEVEEGRPRRPLGSL